MSCEVDYLGGCGNAWVVPTKYLQDVNRGPKIEVLPDLRLRVTRRFDIADQQAVIKDSDLFLENAEIPWGTQDSDYPQCRLIHQDTPGQVENSNKSPNDPPAYIIRVFEEIDRNDRTQVGRTDISYDQYGRKTVVNEFIQFSDGTTAYSDVVGTSTAPAPNSACVLQYFEAPNDGTLIRWKLTYIDSGELSVTDETKFDGGLLLRTLTYLNEVPPTPSGYTLIVANTEYVEGLKVYKYTFACGKVSAGAGGVIDTNVEYFYSADQGTTGITRTTIRYITDPTVVANPITGPVGSELISIDQQESDGYILWTGVYANGTGTISTDVETKEAGNLIIYKKTAINAAPSAPSSTIGGTVVLIDADVQNGTRIEDGTVIYRYTWAEGNGTIDTDEVGEPDGALVQRITTLTAAASTPTSPGLGWYLIRLDQKTGDGYYINSATYKKPPETKTFKKKINFTKPGNAVISGSPPQLVYNPPVTMTLLADVEVSYDTSQITDTPFTVSAWATLYESWTPTDTGLQQARTTALGGYLAGASGTSGTNSIYNGVLCDAWAYQLGSSTPSSFTAAVHVLDTDNDPYLVALDGTVVYRCTKVSYDFS